MCKKLVLLTIVLLQVLVAAPGLSAQDTLWTRTLGTPGWDQLRDLKPTNDGGFIATGCCEPAGSWKAWLVKFDANGDTLWTNYFGPNASNAYGWCVQPTLDGGYVMGGDWNMPGEEACLIKTDSQGQLEWYRTFPDANIRWVLQVSADNYLIAGYSYGYPGYDGFLKWLDADGNLDYAHPNPVQDFPDVRLYCVKPVTDGFAVSGYDVVNASPYGGDVWLCRTDSDGVPIWVRTWGQGGDVLEGTFSLCIMPDGGFLLPGYQGEEYMGEFMTDVFLVRADSDGGTVWTKTYGGSLEDRAWSAAATADGGIVAAGFIDCYGMMDEGDGWLLRLDPNGDTLWTSRLGYPGGDNFYNAVVLGPEEYLVGGYHSRDLATDSYQGWLVRYGTTSCCNLRADIDHNGAGPDIADLVYLVNYMFNGGTEPSCPEEADVDGSGTGPDIADLVYLVNYMFNGGPAPVPCP